MAELAPRASRSGSPLQVERLTDESGVVLRLRGELDLSSAPELERALANARLEKPDRLLIDLSELEFMDSTGLALLVRAEQDSRQDGQRFHLSPGSRQVRRLFDLTGIADRFTFEG